MPVAGRYGDRGEREKEKGRGEIRKSKLGKR
jgi:hypothetical protein